MLKDERVIRKVSHEISSAVDEAMEEVLKQYKDITGHEEDISSQIMSEINIHLVRRIAERLDRKQIGNVTFHAYTYKKSTEEPVTGADLGILVDIQVADQQITKFILIQSKVADSYAEGDLNQVEVRARSPRLVKQIVDMLRITGSSYVAVYSPLGVHVVPAGEVWQQGAKVVDTKTMHYKSLGELMADVFRCFAGRPVILEALGLDYESLLRVFAELTSAQTSLLLAARKTDD